MEIFSYVASSIIIPKLTDYIISLKIEDSKEKRLREEIRNTILVFNTKFVDSEVDSNFFVEYLQDNEVFTSISNQIFYSDNNSKEDNDKLIKKLVESSIIHVNVKRTQSNLPLVKNEAEFEEYFLEIFKILTDFRDSLLTIKDRAVLAILDDSVSASKNEIIETLDSYNDTYLLDQQINQIELLINKGVYAEAYDSISLIFETVSNIHKNKRALLLYHKAKIYFETQQEHKLSNVQKVIQKLVPDSKYIDEIDYWIGHTNKDAGLVSNSIRNLRIKGESEWDLALKESSFQLSLHNFQGVRNILLDNEGNLKLELVNKYQAFSQLAMVSFLNNEFEQAVFYFDNALKIKYTMHSDYHKIISKAFMFFRDYALNKTNKDLIQKKAQEIHKQLDTNAYYVKNHSKELRLQHWIVYLNALAIDDIKLAVEKIDNIDEDLILEESIIVVISEIYYFNEKFEQAIKYLEMIWDKDSILLIRLINSYKELNQWDKIESVFNRNITSLYDSEGVVLSYQIQLLGKIEKGKEGRDLILNHLEVYKNEPIFLKQALIFLREYNWIADYEIVKELILSLPETIEIEEKINLSNVLYGHKEYETIKKLLKSSIMNSNQALELYLHSFDLNKEITDLEPIVNKVFVSGNRSKHLLRLKFLIELNTERFSDAMNSLSEYRTLYNEDTFYKINIVQCIVLGNFNYDATKEVKELVESDDLQNHIILAQYFAYKGRWSDAKNTLRNAYYSYSNQIGELETLGFLQVYFNNFHQDHSEVDFDHVRDDAVVILKKIRSNEIFNVCIHSNDGIVIENGEEKFNCYNFRSTSDESFMLKAIGKKNSCINFNNQECEVVDIIDIDTYFFRYFLRKMKYEYPNNQKIISISGENPKELIEEATVFLKENNKAITNSLELYNFKNGIGVPLTYLSGKDVDKYLDTIYFLMNDETQVFYSFYSKNVKKGSKYVFTISSLVILNSLGYLDKLNLISNQLYVSPSIKSFIRKGISSAIKYDAVVSTAFLDENNSFRMEESTETSKMFRKQFWTDILVSINRFNEIASPQINTSIYNKIYEFVDVSELEAIAISEKENAVLICDDLFISNLSNGISETTTINTISFLYSENIIDISELINLAINLTKKNYLNCINHDMLFEMYVHLLSVNRTNEFDLVYSRVSELFQALFSKHSIQNNLYLYQNFLGLVYGNEVNIEILLELLKNLDT